MWRASLKRVLMSLAHWLLPPAISKTCSTLFFSDFIMNGGITNLNFFGVASVLKTLNEIKIMQAKILNMILNYFKYWIFYTKYHKIMKVKLLQTDKRIEVGTYLKVLIGVNWFAYRMTINYFSIYYGVCVFFSNISYIYCDKFCIYLHTRIDQNISGKNKFFEKFCSFFYIVSFQICTFSLTLLNRHSVFPGFSRS